MKTTITLLTILLSTSLTIYSQNNDDIHFHLYQQELLKEHKKYNNPNQTIRNSLFREKINEVMNHITFGSNDNVINANSIGFILNEEKTNLVTSFNFPINNNGLILKTGLFTSSQSNVFNLFSKNSWNNNVGFNIGLIRKTSSSISFDLNPYKRKDIKRFRKFYVDSLLKAKEKLTLKKLCLIEHQLKFIDISYTFQHKTKNCTTVSNAIKKSITSRISKKGKRVVFDSIRKLKKEYLLYMSDNIKGLVDNELKKFDKKLNIMSGYSVSWLDFNLSGMNSTYNISNDSILTEEILKTKELEKFSRKLNFEFSANWNYLSNKKRLHYIQTGINLKQGNFLDNNLAIGTPLIKKVDNKFILIDEDENKLGFYEQLDKNSIYSSLYFSYAGFYNKKKSIGLKFEFKHHYMLSKKEFFKNNFTLLGGPILRNINADNINKGTFGLQIGFENGVYKTKITDDFVARLTVGLPFEVFSKKIK